MPESEWLNGPIREALMRGRMPVEAPELLTEDKPAADFDPGVRTSPPPPPLGMNQLIRAHMRAHRREPLPEDYLG